ncbi:type I polyketide synthase, partial [Streptomyces sp. NPDC003691]
MGVSVGGLGVGGGVEGFVVVECVVPVGLGVVEGLRVVLGGVLGGVRGVLEGGGGVVVVTRGGVGVGGVVVDPVVSGVWGLVRSVEAEFPGRVVLVDVDEGVVVGDGLGGVLGGVVSWAVGVGEWQVVVRGDGLWVPRLVRVGVGSGSGSEASGSASGSVLVPGSGSALASGSGSGFGGFGSGWVLVSGGTGGLGGVVARRLVEGFGVRRLVLVSRRGLGAPGAVGLRDELVGLGAEVLVVGCDVGDRVGLRGVVGGLVGGLSGVVHVAGVLDDVTVGGLSVERLEGVLRAKADAGWFLHEVAVEAGVDAFVVFSSVAGVVGTAGQAGYAAANGFVDGLVELRRGLGLPGVSLRWGLWEQATGMTDHLTEVDVARMARTGVAPMPTEQGLALFEAALAHGDPLPVPARLDLAELRRRAAAEGVPPLFRELVRPPVRRALDAAGNAGPSWAESMAARSAADREQAALDLVRAEVATVLGHTDNGDSVPLDRAFKDLGFDSLTAVELRNRLGVVTGLELSSTVVFDYPSPVALAGFLVA